MPANLYKNWVLDNTHALRDAANADPDDILIRRRGEFDNLREAGKITSQIRQANEVNSAADEIQAMLRRCDTEEQFQRDIAMWFGYLQGNSAGARLCRRLFKVFQTFGVAYRKANDTWGDVHDLQIPLATLLSHGGRILIQLPAHHSMLRSVRKTGKRLLKTAIWSPIADIIDVRRYRHSYQTTKPTGTKKSVTMGAAVGLSRITGLKSVQTVLSAPAKAADAGDDRFWGWLSGGIAHKRAAATHSTIRRDWSDVEMEIKMLRYFHLPKQHILWFTEEKAGKASNLGDAFLGRHHYKNIALGGKGNYNPFSGVQIRSDGSHGHLYLNYRPPQYYEPGCILVGLEGAAPGMSTQYGKAHTAEAIKGEFSATGGKKWNLLEGFDGTFWKPPSHVNAKGKTKVNNPSDVTIFVCDLSHRKTSSVLGQLRQGDLNLQALIQRPSKMQQTNFQADLGGYCC